jgi:proteasome beta subunit
MIEPPKSFAELVGFDPSRLGAALEETHGTTVLALRYKDGCVVIADRRATMGNYIMFERAEKLYALDDATVIAISGSFARSVEVCRFLKHSFKYYRRMVLQELSLEGKLHEISRTLAENAPLAMQGIGVFIPIVAAYDKSADQFGVYFFDGAGASFQDSSYACAGSGSERIRGVFEYIARKKGPWEEREKDEVLADGLEILAIAADLDTATGGLSGKMAPGVKILTRDGVETLTEEQVKALLP